MKPQPTFIRTNGAVHLNTESAIDLNFSAVIKPGDAEHEDALGLGDAFQNFGDRYSGWLPTRAAASPTLPDRLVKFRFGWVFGLDEVENLMV